MSVVFDYSNSEIQDHSTSNKSAIFDITGDGFEVTVPVSATSSKTSTPGLFINNISITPSIAYVLIVDVHRLSGSCFVWVGSGTSNYLDRNYTLTTGTNTITFVVSDYTVQQIKVGILFSNAIKDQSITLTRVKLATAYINNGSDELEVGTLTATDVETTLLNGSNVDDLIESVSNLENITTPSTILFVNKSPGTGQFSSIKSAVDSITTAGPTNLFVVKVDPGIYVEDTITMKSYVVIVGQSDISTQITVDTPTKKVIIGAFASAILNCCITGATGSGGIGVYYNGTDQSAFLVRFCTFGANETHAHVTSSTGTGSLLQIDNCRLGGTTTAGDFTTGFKATSANGIVSRLVLSNISYRDLQLPVCSKFISLSGADTQCTASNVLAAITPTTGSIGLYIEDGATVAITSSIFNGFGTAIQSANVGSAPTINATAVDLLYSVDYDILIQHPTTSGSFFGNYDYIKTVLPLTGTFQIHNRQANVIIVALKGGDYTSIKAAMDSITDNAIDNSYLIQVSTGDYTEDTIVMKPYVTIIGSSDSTRVLPATSAQHIFVGSDHSRVNRLCATGAGTGYAAFYHNSPDGDANTSFILDSITFGNNDTHVICHATTNISSVQIVNSRYGGDYQFNQGFVATNDNNTIASRIVMLSCTSQGMTLPYPEYFISASGVNCEIILASVLAKTNTVESGTTFIKLENGSKCSLNNVYIENFDKGLFSNNAGDGPHFQAVATSCVGCNHDIVIDNPFTTGGIFGSFDASKVTNASDNLAITIIDSTNFSFTTAGSLFVGKTPATTVDSLDLIQSGPTMGVMHGGEITAGVGLNINVAAGFGYSMIGTYPTHYMIRNDWNDQSLLLPASTDSYVYFNSSKILVSNTLYPSTSNIILLGKVTTNASTISYIHNTPLSAHHYSNEIDRLFREGFGPVYVSGSLVTESGVRKLTATQGKYYFSQAQFLPAGGVDITWNAYYRSATPGVYTEIANQSTVSNAQYDDGSGTLASIPASEYAKHTLYLIGGPSEKYLLIYPQDTYATLGEVQAAPLSTPPAFVDEDIVRVASIIVQQGQTNIIEVIDERPRIGFASSSTVGGITSHSALSDLNADDHLQYLLTNGGRALTGNLDMGSNNIVSVGTVDGVTVSTHAARHLPNGTDPLTTATAITLTAATTNLTGIQNSLARSDHSHAITTGTASTITPDLSNATGVSASIARADHIHNIPTDTAVTIDASSTNTTGVAATFARSDHTHAITTGAPSTLVPDQSNDTGVSANIARADHIHRISTAAGVTLSATTTNGVGVATTFSRSDHTHAISTGAPSAQIPDQINSTGSSANLARADHIHNIPTAAGVTLSATTSNGAGAEATFAKSDHTHAILTGTPSSLNATNANTTGTSANLARADHLHAIATGTAVGLTPDETSAIGVSANLARADHVHNIPTAAAVSISSSTTNTQGVASTFARSDHTHALSLTSSRVASVSLLTTASTTYTLLDTLTITPAAGTYMVTTRANVGATSNNRLISVAIFSGGSIISDSQVQTNIRTGNNTFTSSDIITLYTDAIVTVNGAQAIETRWNTSAGTASCQGCAITILRVA